MPSNTQGTAAREHAKQLVHYLRKEVNFNTTGISSGVAMPAPLPAGAEILRTTVKVKTAFNAASTNVLTVGSNSSSYNNIVGASDVDESSAESFTVLTGADLTFAADTTIYVKYTQSGTAADAGRAIVIIEYVVDNDE